MKRRVLLGLGIGAGAMVLALWGVPLRALGTALAGAELGWLLPVALIFFTQQTLRSWRQILLLEAQGAPRLRLRDSLSVLCISFFFINTLPARIGEVVRPTLLWEKQGVPLGGGVAMVVLERAIDLTAAFTMLALVAWWVPMRSQVLNLQGFELDFVATGRAVASGVLPLLVAGLVGLLLAGPRAVALLQRGLAARSPPRWLARPLRLALGFAGSFVAGLEAVRRPRRLVGVLALTVVIWGMSGWMYALMAHSFGVADLIGYGQGMGVLAITMLGTALPGAPGFAGTYEAFFRGALALYGVSGPAYDADAVAFALTYHWWQYGVQASTAIFFLAVDRVSPSGLWRRARDGWASAAQSRTSSSA